MCTAQRACSSHIDPRMFNLHLICAAPNLAGVLATIAAATPGLKVVCTTAVAGRVVRWHNMRKQICTQLYCSCKTQAGWCRLCTCQTREVHGVSSSKSGVHNVQPACPHGHLLRLGCAALRNCLLHSRVHGKLQLTIWALLHGWRVLAQVRVR